jgi:transposase-like protein
MPEPALLADIRVPANPHWVAFSTHGSRAYWASPRFGGAMAGQYRKFDQDFQPGAVRLVLETGKPIAQVARELGINEGSLGNWCAQERRSRAAATRAEQERARRAGAAAEGECRAADAA